MIKKITLALILFLFLALPSAVLAKRVLPRAQTTSTTTTNRAGNKPAIQVRFRDDRNAVLVNFSNLSNATEISYEFSYESNGTKQGVQGTITDMSVDPTSRELLFGTCSNNICRYDTNVTNAKLTITLTLKDGKRYVKPYILRK